MLLSKLFAAFTALATAQAAYIGFNYDASVDFATEFKRAKNLAGTNNRFTSARLYTMIAPGTTNTPIGAIQAAIDTKTTLLLGMWASAGQAQFNNEVAALKAAIKQHGTAFTDLIAGISVGSEDLYRISATGIANKSGAGAEPAEIVKYIQQVRAAIKGTAAAKVKVGHVDTADVWSNSTNAAVVTHSDWLGMDEYPFYETTKANAIGNAHARFYENFDKTKAASKGKPVWVTETGWPVSGAKSGQAVASKANAETYWKKVGCGLFGTVNTWYYILQDPSANPSFGVVPQGNLQGAPLYNLKC